MANHLGFCVSLVLAIALAPGSAQTTELVTAASLQHLLDESRYLEFSQQLGHADNLTVEQHQYFLGVLAFHVGRFEDAIKPLIAAVNTPKTSLTPNQVEEGLETLAQNAMRQSQYGACAQIYDTIDKTLGPRMSDGGKSIQNKRHLAALLQHEPAQTIQIGGDFTLPRTGLEYPVSIGGKSFSAQFDTGAEISMLSASTAKNWGVTMIEGTATLYGYSGGAFSVQPGFIPVLNIGKAELHNVGVYVTADENLYIAKIKLQLHALLGFPVVWALGRLTFAKDGSLTVSAESPPADPSANIRLWFGGHSILLPLGTAPVMSGDKLSGVAQPRLMVLDTGSLSSYLTDHYLAEHTDIFHGPPPETAHLAGGGGTRDIPAYAAHGLPLFVGNLPMLLNGQHILSQPTTGEFEHYFGVIGQDLLQNFSSYTLDFRTGAFSVRP